MQVHDEVCGMTILADTAAATMDFQGGTYYFCSDRCAAKFKEHPGWYVEVTEDSEDVADDESGATAEPETDPHHHHHQHD